jgi:hypothetical protein
VRCALELEPCVRAPLHFALVDKSTVGGGMVLEKNSQPLGFVAGDAKRIDGGR